MGTESWRQIRDTCDTCGTVWEGPVGATGRREFIRFYEEGRPYNEAERETVERTFCSWDCVGKYAAGRKDESPEKLSYPKTKLEPELLQRMRNHCEKLVEVDGICDSLDCSICPGSMRFNDYVDCTDNGWAGVLDTSKPDPVAKASAERFLAEHPMREGG